VSNETVNRMMEVASEAGIEFEVFENVLNDHVIFYDASKMKLKGVRRSNFIIIQDTFLNSQNSELRMFVTDSEKKMKEYEQAFSY